MKLQGVLIACAALALAWLAPPRSPWPIASAQELYLELPDRLLIVTVDDMKAAATEYADARMAAYGQTIDTRDNNRRHNRLNAEVVTVRECIRQHPGLTPAEAVRAVVREKLIVAGLATAKWDDATIPSDDRYVPRSNLLLIGDVPTEGGEVDPAKHVPCFYRHAQVIPPGVAGTQEEWEDVPSDNRYACRDEDDDVPLFPVGRLPYTVPAQLQAHLAAVKAYETSPPPGAWRGRVTIFAGDPGFEQLGPMVRRLIERAYELGVIQNLSDAYDATFTYANEASPYTWPAPEFSQKIVSEINEGALILNYLGHGWKDSVDTLTYNGRRYRAFTAADAARVDCHGKRPVAAFFTCYTGAFDYRSPSLAEALMLNPNGPIGVIASSRISNEINYMMETSFLHVTTKLRVKTLGETFLRTKRRMLNGSLPIPPAMAQQFGLPTHRGYSDGKRNHLWMYNLFGDPTVRIAHARDISADIHPEEALRAGEKFAVQLLTGNLEGVAKVSSRLECNRTQFLLSPREVDGNGREAAIFEQIRNNHARANHRLVDSRESPTVSDTVELRLPADLPPGDYLLKKFVYDSNGNLIANGGITVKIAPPAQVSPGGDF